MNSLENLDFIELDEINGGGLASCAAGALAGGIIGAFASLPYAAYTRNGKTVVKAAIAGASVGAYVGAGCPLP